MLRKILLPVLLVAALVQASPVHAEEEEPPPMELLEFLAEFETEGGDWVAPSDIEEMEIPEQERTENAQ